MVAELEDGGVRGRGEAVPYARYGETIASVIEAIQSLGEHHKSLDDIGGDHLKGAAANALDCAQWDLRAKLAGKPVAELLGIAATTPIPIAATISLDTPENMAAKASTHRNPALIKLKVDGSNDIERVRAIHSVHPECKIIVDANEAWSTGQLKQWSPELANLGVEFIEQPLPRSLDHELATFEHAVPICADESVFGTASLQSIVGRYDVVNIKLDKTGGMSKALHTLEEARRLGFATMVGCMVSTSLSIAPAFIVAQQANYADLDGALLLEKDRPNGMRLKDRLLQVPPTELWG